MYHQWQSTTNSMLSTPIVPDLDYDHVYEPAEDTFLFLDLFEQLHAEKFYLEKERFNHKTPLIVEIGSGSGVISTFISTNKIVPNSLSLATDINLIALQTTLDTHLYNSPSTYPFDVIRSNLTDPIRTNQIDLLLFNPPYVPSEEIPDIPDVEDTENTAWLDLALVGGDDGMKITNVLLNDLNRILSINGHAYILFCARNKHPLVVENFKNRFSNFTVECVIARKCGWEELAIYRFKKLS